MSARDDMLMRLSAWMEGELPSGQREEIDRALASDERLAEELRRLEAMRRMLRGMPRLKAPRDFADGVLSKIERASLVKPAHAAPEERRAWLRLLPTAAVVVVAVAAGLIVARTLLEHSAQVGIQTSTQIERPPRSAPDRAGRQRPAEREPIAAALTPGDAAPAEPASNGGDWLGTPVRMEDLHVEPLLVVAGQSQIVLQADDLSGANSAVQRLLLSHGVPPALVADPADPAADRAGPRPAGMSYFHERTSTDRLVVIDVQGDVAQVAAIERGVRRLPRLRSVSLQSEPAAPVAAGDPLQTDAAVAAAPDEAPAVRPPVLVTLLKHLGEAFGGYRPAAGEVMPRSEPGQVAVAPATDDTAAGGDSPLADAASEARPARPVRMVQTLRITLMSADVEPSDGQ